MVVVFIPNVSQFGHTNADAKYMWDR